MSTAKAKAIYRPFVFAVSFMLSAPSLAVHSQSATRPSASRNRETVGAPGIKTDRRVYAESSPPRLPEAGGTLVDPVFGTTILRVTDERDGKSNETPYSYWPSFNRNSTRLYVKSDDQSILFGFDPDNFGVTTRRKMFQRPLPEGGYPWADDVIWSGKDDNTVYCHQGLRIYSYNVVTNNFELIRDFAGQVPGDLIWQMSKSLDDDTFGFHLKNSRDDYRVVGYAAWKRGSNALYVINDPKVNEVQVDKSGRYLAVTMEPPERLPAPPDSYVEVRIVDLQTRRITDLKDGGPDYSPGHHDCGQGTIIGADNWNNSYTFRSLSNPHKFTMAVGFGSDWSLSGHVSLLADDERWALVSTFLANKLPSSGVFKNELFLVATDGSGRVRRIAHHHSVFRDYADTPRANISRDGRFAAFTSNWGSTARRDVFVVQIPPLTGTERYDATVPKPEPSNPHTPAATTTPVTTGPPPRAIPAKPANAATTPSSAAQPVTWAAISRCVVIANGLRKIEGVDGSPDAGARSEQVISAGDGYVEFTASETRTTRLVGLARDPAGVDFGSVDFAVKLTSGGTAEVRENNAYAGETPYRAGDVFRIAIESNTVKYFRNGTLFFTSLNPPAYPLVVKASIATAGGRVDGVVVSGSNRQGQGL